MLDVHPPHHPTHTWRDFLIHIATIVVGLCIAVGLEQTVELFHHRHIVHQARENIREEIRTNQKTIADDRRALSRNRDQMRTNLALLANRAADPAAAEKINFDYHWNGASNAAYQTARDTSALALMPYEEVEGYTGTYYQQNLVNEQAITYLRRETSAYARIENKQKVASLSPEAVAAITTACEQSLADINFLEVLLNGLEANYAEVLKQQP